MLSVVLHVGIVHVSGFRKPVFLYVSLALGDIVPFDRVTTEKMWIMGEAYSYSSQPMQFLGEIIVRQQ